MTMPLTHLAITSFYVKVSKQQEYTFKELIVVFPPCRRNVRKSLTYKI